MSIIVSSPRSSPADAKNSTVQDITDLLQEGESQIIYSTNKDVILLLGKTGSGKSTFSQFITGYDDNLKSEELKKDDKNKTHHKNKRRTREFLIIDKYGKISNNTFESKTIFPNLMLDTETHAAFYDCPGFSDTRSPAHDIAATYFIKKIIDHAKRVKLVFTINHSSVRDGVDRAAFPKFVKNAVEMIKNIKKFDHSIALIITKVDNSYHPEYNENGDQELTLDSDEEIIESIATFLQTAKDYLQPLASINGLDSVEAKSVEFIDALLHTKDEEYTNIGIFRRPNKAGVLTSIKLLQERKPSLKKIIHENIQFHAYDKNDFGYTISAESRNHLHDLITKINENIVTNIVNIGQEIEKYYISQEKQSRDIQDLYNKFRLAYDSLSATKISAFGIAEPHQLLKMITKNVNDLDISISTKNFQNIINHQEYLKFIKTIDGQSSVMKPAEWAQALTNVIEYLDDSQRWYSFLNRFHDILSKYDVQQDINEYSSIIDSLKYQITVNENNQKIVLAQFKQLLDKVSKEESEREYNNIKDVKLNKSKIKVLTDLLNLTLKYKIDWSCDNNNLIVKGQYVRLSDVLSKNCEKPKSIEIFALNKLFVDTTLDKTGDKVQLFMIAPQLEIIGNQSIILNGSPATSLKPEKARNALAPGAKGDDGIPGKPGGPTGHFLSIAQNVINGKYLNISLVGGKGGPGQHGGDGKKGEDGTVPKVPNKYEKPIWGDGFSVKQNITKRVVSPGLFLVQNEYDHRWEVRGKHCTRGGNGGDGGAGGKGGNSINATIINLIEEAPKFVMVVDNGKAGISGTGGRGGEAADKEGEILILQSRSLAPFKASPNPERFKIISQDKLSPCGMGNRGNDGNNTKNMTEPEKVILTRLPSAVINDYKKYVRDNLSNSIMESYLRKFQDDLESHQLVQNLYDVFGFVNELQGLEDQFYALRKKLSLLPFYKSLLNRIAQYSNKLYENNELKDDNKKVLGYLYTATLSKIYSINNNAGNNLVMDLPKYLEGAKQEINKLKDLRNVESINEEQAEYQKGIVEKIKEATDFVESQIHPAINDVFYEIGQQIELLIDETVALKNATQEEKQKLEEQQQKLGDTLALKMLFDVLKMGSQFLSFLGPVGTAAGTVIGVGLMITESLTLNDSSSEVGSETIAALPAAVKNSLPKITEQLKEQKELFKEQLADSQRELKDFLNSQPVGDIKGIKDIKDIEKKVAETKNELEKEMAEGHSLSVISIDKMHTMRKEIADLLQKKIGILEELQPGEDLKIDNRLKIVQRIDTIVSAAQIPIDFYNKIKNDQAKLNALSLAIKNTDKKLNELMVYEQTIYNKILPICKNIEDTVNKMESNLQGKSHAALDISQWQIQNTLRDIKLKMQKMTKESTIEEDLIRCIEKLEEGMTFMIKMYDHIQNYHDKAELADYIANINSNRAIQIYISNEGLRHEVDNLRRIIQSNLVLEKYETSMNAFRQHVFPFAEFYMADFDLPSSLKSNDTDSIVANAAEKITVLKTRLIESTITMTKKDKLIHSRVEFNGQKKAMKPFFVWKNNKHKNAIKNLLEGKEITIKSDIKQGLNKNAIKFNTIRIDLKTANEKLQNELNKQLEDFQLEMTHMGTSYYRCDNKFYVISSDNQTVTYTFAKDENGNPVDSVDTYKKFEKYEPLLSPYTWWKVKINQYDAGTGHTFKPSLEKYKDEEIDLELVGDGQYVDRGIDVCNSNLDKYYVVDNTTLEIDDIVLSKQQILPGIPMTKSLNTLTKNNTKYIKRKRRSVDEHHEFISTSGACSNMRSSFINNIFNLIGSGLVAYEYLNPLNKIGQWFTKEEKINKVYEDLVALDDAVPKTMNWVNAQSADFELPADVSNLFINHESSTAGSSPNGLMFCNNGNLLLLDLIIRRKNGIKYQHKDFVADQKHDSEFAQSIAYHAYAPKI